MRASCYAALVVGLSACASAGSSAEDVAPLPPTSAAERPPAPSSSTRVSGRDAELLGAAYGNDVRRAEALIRAGADVNARDGSAQSAFLIATSEVGDDPRLLDLALAAGADVNAKDGYHGTGLIRAAERGYPRIIARLLTTEVDVNHVNDLGWTALLEAVVLGEGGPEHTETVRLLIDGGADVQLPNSEGVSALAHAERRGYREIAELLRAAGAR